MPGEIRKISLLKREDIQIGCSCFFGPVWFAYNLLFQVDKDFDVANIKIPPRNLKNVGGGGYVIMCVFGRSALP